MEEAGLVSVLMALEFAAFGWRINREIQVGDERLRTWLPIPDLLNIAAFLSVVAATVVLPLADRTSARLSATVVALAWTLIALHPINVAAHYRLFSKEGRRKYEEQGREIPYTTDQEYVTLILTLVVVISVGASVWN